jgi:Kef-type K+ transport system membrane component KefB
LDPLWTILLAAGHMAILWFVGRRILAWLCEKVKKTGTLTPLNFTLFLLIVFVVSWFTDQVGVSAMFGAFEVGVLVPRKGPAARLVKDKLEGKITGAWGIK